MKRNSVTVRLVFDLGNEGSVVSAEYEVNQNGYIDAEKIAQHVRNTIDAIMLGKDFSEVHSLEGKI